MAYLPSHLAASLSPRAVIVDDPVHAAVGHTYAVGEAAARAGSVEASLRAGTFSSAAAAASVNASHARAGTIAQSGRTALQGSIAAGASLREGATAAAHHASTVVATAAGAEVSVRGTEFHRDQANLVAAEGVLGARALDRDFAGRRAAERDIHSVSAAAAAAQLGAVRHERSAEASIASARATAAGADAANARASERAAGTLAHDISVAAALSRTKATSAEAQAAAAEGRRAEAAAAVAAASAAAREASAVERAASSALALAGREANAARVTAAQTRAEASAVEQQARARALHHGATAAEADIAARRAAAEHAGAANASSVYALADKDAQVAAVDASVAARDAAAARADLAVRGTEEALARGQVAEAHGSLGRSGRMLQGAQANYARASVNEVAARGAHGAAVTHASIERVRHAQEEGALAHASAREAFAVTNEAGVHASARLAGLDAARAGDVARAASLTRAVHDVSPRHLTVIDPLSPSVRTMATSVGSPLRTITSGSPILDAKLAALGSPSRYY